MDKKVISMLFFGLAAAALGSLAAGLVYFQGVLGLNPCPMCALQRVSYAMGGLLSLVSGTLAVAGAMRQAAASGLLSCLSLAGGAVVAGRQAWLVRDPDAFGCGVSIESRILDASGLAGVWPEMFEATGACGEVAWELLGHGMADWSLLALVAMAMAALFGAVLSWRRRG